LLQTSPQVSALPEEGQFISAVEPLMRKAPWNEQTELPWPIIKNEWNKHWDLNKPILLEKSPPHLLRAQAIEQNFENSYFIIMVRNPFAYCEGTKRRGRTGLGYSRDASYSQIAEGWVNEGRHQVHNLRVLQRVLCVTYEELTDNPAETTARLLAFMPALQSLNIQAAFLIHSLSGWVERPLTNLNAKQIARLSAEDIAEINAVLQKHPAILAQFGYEVMPGAYSLTARTHLAISTLYTKYVSRTIQRLTRRTRRTNRGQHIQ
jgi:hypothetical protein